MPSPLYMEYYDLSGIIIENAVEQLNRPFVCSCGRLCGNTVSHDLLTQPPLLTQPCPQHLDINPTCTHDCMDQQTLKLVFRIKGNVCEFCNCFLTNGTNIYATEVFVRNREAKSFYQEKIETFGNSLPNETQMLLPNDDEAGRSLKSGQ